MDRVVAVDEPFALGGFTFSATYGWGWNVTAKVRVEVSDDGRAWRETETIDVWLSSNGRSDCNDGQERHIAFTRPACARQVRVTMEPKDKTFVYKSFRPELRRGLPELNARIFRSYDNFAPCTHEVGADGTVDPKRIVNLTDWLGADGTFEWTAPAGTDWIVLRVGYASNGAVVRCSFRTVNAVPQLWDAESGERFRPYDWKFCGDHIEMTLPFKPCGSWFVVFSPKDDGAALPVLEDPAKRVPRLTEEVGGDWELSFTRGWNCPDKVTLPKLVSWTEIPDGEVRYFSGIATYAKTMALPLGFADGKGRVVLDLGQVKNVAEVTVNGKAYPPLWRPPFRVDVTDAVRAGEPVRLAVRVANLWPNRLIGDEQKPADCEWGYLWDKLAIKEIPDWMKSGKPSPTGRLAFTTWHHWTKDDKLLPSGLLGPVQFVQTAGQ